MLPCVCSVIDHRGRQNVPLFCSYHILTSSVIYYVLQYNYASQTEVQLIYLHRYCLHVNCSSH